MTPEEFEKYDFRALPAVQDPCLYPELLECFSKPAGGLARLARADKLRLSMELRALRDAARDAAAKIAEEHKRVRRAVTSCGWKAERYRPDGSKKRKYARMRLEELDDFALEDINDLETLGILRERIVKKLREFKYDLHDEVDGVSLPEDDPALAPLDSVSPSSVRQLVNEEQLRVLHNRLVKELEQLQEESQASRAADEEDERVESARMREGSTSDAGATDAEDAGEIESDEHGGSGLTSGDLPDPAAVPVIEIPTRPEKRVVQRTPLTEIQRKACFSVLDQVVQSEDAAPFLEPVDYKALGILMYPLAVRDPMDLGTLRQNLENASPEGRVCSASDFVRDIMLIWDNAMYFNVEFSSLYQNAQRMRNMTRSLLDGHSSLRGVRPTAGRSVRERAERPAWTAKMLEMVENILDNPVSAPFRLPVDADALGIPLYKAVVREPKCLFEVYEGLQEGEYESAEDAAYDILLVFRNAVLFNTDGHPLCQSARKLALQFLHAADKMPELTWYHGMSRSRDVMNVEWRWACRRVLRNVQRTSFSVPFLAPVDAEALGIPDYYNVIESPMDLGTVEKKLRANSYASMADFARDVDLVWKNAMTFNKQGTEMFAIASSMEMVFAKAYTKAVVDVLASQRHAVWFIAPVDPDALGIPWYREIVKRPMDLGTISKKLARNAYRCVAVLERDVLFMAENALVFNEEGSEAHEAAKRIRSQFNRWIAPVVDLPFVLGAGGAAARRTTESTLEAYAKTTREAKAAVLERIAKEPRKAAADGAAPSSAEKPGAPAKRGAAKQSSGVATPRASSTPRARAPPAARRSAPSTGEKTDGRSERPTRTLRSGAASAAAASTSSPGAETRPVPAAQRSFDPSGTRSSGSPRSPRSVGGAQGGARSPDEGSAAITRRRSSGAMSTESEGSRPAQAGTRDRSARRLSATGISDTRGSQNVDDRTSSAGDGTGARPSVKPINASLLEQAGEVLDHIMQLKKAEPFLELVDPVRDGVPHYHEIVKIPVCLRMVKTRLTGGMYVSVEELQRDIRLVWSNAMLFNQDGSYIFKAAEDLSSKFEHAMEQLQSGSSAGLVPASPRNRERSSARSTSGATPETMRRTLSAGMRMLKRHEKTDFVLDESLREL